MKTHLKELLLTGFALTIGASALAQGTVIFINRSAGTITTHVYAPLTSNPIFSQIGQGSNDLISGTTSWAGFTPISANGTGGQFGAATVFATLLGASGYNQPESSLEAAAGVTTFKTGVSAGAVFTTTATFNNIAPGAPQATLEMVAWEDSSGLYSTWTLASIAWLDGLITYLGRSNKWNQDSLGGNGDPAPYMVNGEIPGQQLFSFNLYMSPEPSSFALAGPGVATLLIFRRNRNR